MSPAFSSNRSRRPLPRIARSAAAASSKAARRERPAARPDVELAGELRGHVIADGLAGGDDGRDPGVQQTLHLGAGGATVEEHQRQPVLLRQESGQAGRIGCLPAPARGSEQQPITARVACEMEDGDAIPLAAERGQDALGRGVGLLDQLDQPRVERGGQCRAHPRSSSASRGSGCAGSLAKARRRIGLLLTSRGPYQSSPYRRSSSGVRTGGLRWIRRPAFASRSSMPAIPDACGPVRTGSDNQLAVRTVGRRVDRVGVAAELADFLPRGRVPDAGGRSSLAVTIILAVRTVGRRPDTGRCGR